MFCAPKGGIHVEYMTVTEAAKKWNVSNRMVQKYCANGRIEGAKKLGLTWSIPAGAAKPKCSRKDKCMEVSRAAFSEEAFRGLMPLMNQAFRPGQCMEYINSMEDGPRKEIARAEYHYFSGQAEKAAQESELFLMCPDLAVQLSACLLYGYANLSIGQIYHAKYALKRIQDTLGGEGETTAYARATVSFAAAAAAVLLHLPLPDGMPSIQELLPVLPMGLQAFALYVHAHYLYLQERYETSVGVAETALAMGARQYPIPAIYLHLVAVMSYMSLRNVELAEKHLLAAWQLARPDDLIEGFGEHHGLLGGMLEAVIKPKWPEDFKRMIAITYRFSAGWRKIHNPETGNSVADNLTTTEFATAMLAARGWTNQEIGRHMNISPNTVKRYLASSMEKIGVSRRKDLKQYMLQ